MMSLKLYNTLTRKKEVFEPIQPGKVSMYVCGPTVYDYIHIGNARPMIFFDVFRKYLQHCGYEVKYIVNFTDVDDKLIKKANETGETVPEIADRFIQAYYEDAESLGVERADIHPRVTENIAEVIAFIEGLVDKQFAYESGGDVYFRTNRFESYGKLSQQDLEELQLGIRVAVDERKENPQDFVLWKGAKPGEISWDSPWGKGRPGWHIECSAMASKYLGETIDIHGGGQDLTFPHHECELAQSEALHDKPLARYWMHNGYIHMNNQKMSKSLGNGISVKQLRQRYSMEAVRYFMLSTHYRHPLHFSEEVMQQAQRSVDRIHNGMTDLLYRINQEDQSTVDIDESVQQQVEQITEQFHHRMQDDVNTADALTAMFDLISVSNQYLQREHVNKQLLQLILDRFREMNRILRIYVEPEAEQLLDEEIEALIEERNLARKNKDFARADEIRDLLKEKNIMLEDTPQGVRWRRI